MSKRLIENPTQIMKTGIHQGTSEKQNREDKQKIKQTKTFQKVKCKYYNEWIRNQMSLAFSRATLESR